MQRFRHFTGGGVTKTSQINRIWIISHVKASNSERTGLVSVNTGGFLEDFFSSNSQTCSEVRLGPNITRPAAEASG